MAVEDLVSKLAPVTPTASGAKADWAGMTAGLTSYAAGHDSEAVLRTLAGDGLCPVPHWGHVVSGTLGIRYSDGREELAHAGDAYFMEPGHAPFTRDGCVVFEVMPSEELARFSASLGR